MDTREPSTAAPSAPEHRLDEVYEFCEQEKDKGRPVTLAILQVHFSDVPDEQLGEILALLPPPFPKPVMPDEGADEDAEILQMVLGSPSALALLGRGATGDVYRADDPVLGCELAVKVLRRKHRGRVDLAWQLTEEARMTGRLDHPGVVPVHALGKLPDGRPYFTMKLVRGRTLADLLAERTDLAPDRPRFLKVFEQVSQTLAYAHSKGMIHRDLKPLNMMVGAFGEVQVMDWGFAKQFGTKPEPPEGGPEDTAVDSPSAVRTHWHQVVGTVAYMAPEQARGEVDKLDARCDVFGLGAILCEILTGGPPYLGRTWTEVFERAKAGDLADARTRLNGCGADAELLDLARRCLAVEPAERPRDAGEVAAAVTAYLAGVEARLRRAERERAAAKTKAMMERTARRRTTWLAAALAAALLAGVVGLLLYWSAERERAAAAHSYYYASSISGAGRALDVGHRDRAEQILDTCPRDLRRLEWHLLKRACQPEAITLRNHRGPVIGIVSDLTDDQLMATAGVDGTVRLWDAKSHQQRHLLDQRDQALSSLASGHQARYLAAAGEDAVVKVWDLTQPDRGPVFEAKAGTVVALARDVPKIATAGRDQKVRVWDLPAGRLTHTFEYAESVNCLTFSPDGKWLAVGGMITGASQGHPLKIWDLTTEEEANHFQLDLQMKDAIYGLAWGGTEGQYLIATTVSTARIWDVPTGKRVGLLPGYESWATGLAFHRGGRHLAASFSNGAVRVWAFQENGPELVFSAHRHPRAINSVSLNVTGDRVAYTKDNEVIVERWNDHGGVRPVAGQHFAFSPNGNLVATASREGELSVLDSATLEVRKTLSGPAAPITALAFSPGGTRLATALRNDRVRVWNPSTGHEITSWDHHSPVLCVAYSPDGTLLASSTEDRLIHVWDAATGQARFKQPLRLPEDVRCLAFSPSGKHLAAACSNWTVTLWHLDMNEGATEPPSTTLPAHRLGVTCVTFSPDGRWLASASEDQTVKIWSMKEIQSGNTYPEKTLQHNTGVASVAFSQDDHRLVSLGRDGYVRCWETATGQELLAFTRRHPSGRSPGVLVGFNPDPNRRQLATAFEDGFIEIRDWALADVADR